MNPNRPRDPSTFPGAMLEVIQEIGVNNTANIAERQEDTVYGWTNETRAGNPLHILETVTKIDVAFQDLTGHRGPFIRLMERKQDLLLGCVDDHGGDLLTAFFGLQKASLGITGTVDQLRNPSGPNGLRELSPVERYAFLEQIQKVRDAADELESALGTHLILSDPKVVKMRDRVA